MTRFLPRTFRHGIHPEENKEETEHLPTARMPFVERYILPLSQHTGAPCRPVVEVGERVVRGQLVAEPGGFVSTTLHSPVTGRIAAIAPRLHPNGKLTESIEIEADPFATQKLNGLPPIDWRSLSIDDFVAHVQRAGLVGMGGAAFPTHVKYKLPEGKRVRRLVVNGCECEPFLTTDHRVMVERPEAIVRGIEILAERLGVEETAIGVELNKPDAIEALRGAIPEDSKIRVVPLKVKYPQGAEKMLIRAIYGVEVPAGKLPLDVETVVNNVGTMAALADYFDHGRPLIERVVTVAGPGIERPANLLVPVGTPVRAVLDYCGGLTVRGPRGGDGGADDGLPALQPRRSDPQGHLGTPGVHRGGGPHPQRVHLRSVRALRGSLSQFPESLPPRPPGPRRPLRGDGEVLRDGLHGVRVVQLRLPLGNPRRPAHPGGQVGDPRAEDGREMTARRR